MTVEGVAGGLLAALVAAAGTALGALVVLVRREWSSGARAFLLAGAAGVMLGATLFSLVLPALSGLQDRLGTSAGALAAAGVVVLGALAVSGLNRVVPHEHAVKGREGPATGGLDGPTLFVLAIALHNVPEGLSVGVASTADFAAGLPVLLGITAQNLPEGFAVAAALLSRGTPRGRAAFIGAATGLAEVGGGLAGALAVSSSALVVPFAFSFAAGAMLFVISGEVIPETHADGKEAGATLALVGGFVAMMLLDVLLA